MASKGPGLTFFFIGLIIAVGVLLMVYEPNYGIYNNFLSLNGVTPDNAYTSNFVSKLKTTQNKLNGTMQEYSKLSWGSVLETGSSVVSGVFSIIAIGFGAIRSLASLPVYVNDIFSAISSMTYIPPAIWWIITCVITIFLASKFIKAMRGQQDDV